MAGSDKGALYVEFIGDDICHGTIDDRACFDGNTDPRRLSFDSRVADNVDLLQPTRANVYQVFSGASQLVQQTVCLAGEKSWRSDFLCWHSLAENPPGH